MRRICRRIAAIFASVHSAGGVLFFSAAFSAGRPKESQPMGCSTFEPRIHMKRASASPMA
jgi:hypothetical protein